jgi:thiol-disulfide isomerase/thioredoxin
VRARAASPLRQAADDYTLKMCSLNRIGTPAADFPFTDLKGRIRTLYGVKADFTVLFFSNPGCPACHDIVERIRELPNVEKAIEEGRLAVVNVYIDQDVAKWLELSGEYPRSWICGYDHNYLIRSDVLYNVRAIPSLYLLDADKKVLLKDTPQENVLGFIRGL